MLNGWCHRRLRLTWTAFLLLSAVPGAARGDRTDHKSYRDVELADCRACHEASGVADNHGAQFMTEHRLLAQKASNNCEDCHQQSFCVDCHKGGEISNDQKSLSRRGESMPESHGADFVSTHAIQARDDPQSCYRCHESARFCSDCHLSWIQKDKTGMMLKAHQPVYVAPGVADPNWVAFHRADARRNLQNCQGCHPAKSDCSNFACHPNLNGR